MLRRSLLVGFVALSLFACSPPEPPTITVKEAKITGVDLRGMSISVHVEATNKNRFDLTLGSFEGKILLDGKDAGTVTLVKPLTLATGERTPVDVPLFLTWNDLGMVAAAALSGRDVPYSVDGIVGIGGGKLSVRLPIKASGTIPQKDLATAAQRSLPKLPFAIPK